VSLFHHPSTHVAASERNNHEQSGLPANLELFRNNNIRLQQQLVFSS
jgi:hypothetical protein